MKILISGSRGLIGSALVKKLKELKHEVYGFDIEEDYKDRKYNLIIHCASNCIIRDLIKYPYLMMNNLHITYVMLELARETGAKIILFSSGRLNHPDISNPYIASKKFMEEAAKAYHDCYGVRSIIIRPETIWSEEENSIRVIPNWLNCAKENKPIVVYGDSNKELSPMHIDDFVHEFIRVMNHFDKFESKSPITITGNTMTVSDIIKIIKEKYKSISEIIYKPAELSQPQYCAYIENVLTRGSFSRRLLLPDRKRCKAINKCGGQCHNYQVIHGYCIKHFQMLNQKV